ncbi:MAG TPA: glycosyltransferase family 2 protein [Candidatus Saccharimonadales bacterium]|nr:glycosyltransferase family 2 protein [Candidatus Saccharimonadales bacterium]
MTKSKIRVSLVIPAYNEESYLALCLEAIAAQTVRPFEVIVVDNNSTDATAEIARRYPFVTLLSEPRQGLVYARNRGFNAARGDVIGRTDSDAVLAPDWVANVQRTFADSQVAAASGVVRYRDIGLRKVFDGIDSTFRRFLAARSAGRREIFLYGVTMGIRRSVWREIQPQLCTARRMAEDLDLAAHLAATKHRVVFAPRMEASFSPRQAASGPREFYRYVWSGPRTYRLHGLASQRYMYPMALFVTVCYLPIRLLYKGYDPATQRFSVAYALRSGVRPRVSPVSELI